VQKNIKKTEKEIQAEKWKAEMRKREGFTWS